MTKPDDWKVDEEDDMYSDHRVVASGEFELDFPSSSNGLSTATTFESTEPDAVGHRTGSASGNGQELVSFKYELYHVFDAAETEVWLLMKDSLTRYQQTKTYEKMAIGKALKQRRGTNGFKRRRLSATSTASGTVSSFWRGIKKQLSVSIKLSDNSGSVQRGMTDELDKPLLKNESPKESLKESQS